MAQTRNGSFCGHLHFYIMTLLGKSAIIILPRLDPRLHTPMYFFLANLSFLNLCYTTSTGPQMLVNIQSRWRNISYGGCIAQLFIFLGLGSTECVLLSVMAFDHYVAICQPLHYTVIIHSRLCQQLAVVAWITGFSNSLEQTVLTFLLPAVVNIRWRISSVKYLPCFNYHVLIHGSMKWRCMLLWWS